MRRLRPKDASRRPKERAAPLANRLPTVSAGDEEEEGGGDAAIV